MNDALAGLRVLELATHWAAPGVGALLADYGADVLKVEDTTGDPLREVADPRVDVPLWALAGRGKRGVVLPLRTAAGQERLGELLARSDVILLNQSDKVLAGWGTSLSALAAACPAAIICVISAFGHDDPRTGNGTTVEAASGLLAASGTPGLSPILLGDYVTTMSAAVAVLAAVCARASGGGSASAGSPATGGRVIDVRMADAALAAALPDLNRKRDGDPVPVRDVAPTADGRHVAISATSGPQRARLAELIGRDWSAASPARMTQDFRDWAATRPHAEVVAALAARRVPAQLVAHPREAALRRREERPSAVATIHDERFGEVLLPVPPGVDPGGYRPALGTAPVTGLEDIPAVWNPNACQE